MFSTGGAGGGKPKRKKRSLLGRIGTRNPIWGESSRAGGYLEANAHSTRMKKKKKKERIEG